MRKRTKFKSPVLDFFVIVLTLSVAGYFGYTFWKDLNSSSRRTDKEKIAIITFKNRIAQRKYDDRVVWERIDKSTPLYNGDLIRTAELAEAVITFNDGSQVDIYENTMIQVYYSEFEGVNISIGNGNLQLDSSDKGNVQLTLSDGSKIKAGGGTSLAAKTGSDGKSSKTVEIRNGSATVTASSGATESMLAGESLSVKNGGELAKKPVTVTSIPPELRVLNVEGEDTEVPVKIEWNKVNKNSPVILQTSSKKDFSEITEERIITSVNDALLSLSDGTLYWRVFTQNNEEEASQGKISVESTDPLALISPSDEGIFQYRNRNPSLGFRWNGNDYAANYLLKVSSTPDMNNVVYKKIVTNPYVQMDELGCGQWWWQVTPYYEMNSIGYAGSSAVGTFVIERSEGINPPSLTVPLPDAEIHYRDCLDINFSWKSDIKANYQLLVSTNEDFSDILLRRNTAGQRASVSLAAPDSDGQTYYWKVIRNSSEPDDLSPESEVRHFTVSKYISVPTKLLYPPEEYSVESTKIAGTRFSWKPSDEAKAAANDSIIQFSQTRDFDKVEIEKTVAGTSVENLSVASGDWYWRVATQTADGYKEYTQPNHLLVQEELKAPNLTNVLENAAVVVAKDSSVHLAWAPVAGADFYNVKVYDTNDKLVAEKPEASGTSAFFNLPDASYSVRIQAVASQTEISPLRTGPVETVDFSVRTPIPVQAQRPYASERIDGLSALRNPVNFSWKESSDKASTTELLLKKRQNDGSLKVVQRIPVNKNSYSLSRLSSGSYTWQIVASTKDGIPLDSDPVNFTITPVADLPKPVLSNPSGNLVMDSKYLRKNRSISFEWKEVPGATEYNFILYKKEKNGNLTTVMSEKGVKGTKVKLKKLSILDKGTFEWNVTAYSYQKDGFEERRSPTSRNTFDIKFDSPVQIKAEKKGRMYSAD